MTVHRARGLFQQRMSLRQLVRVPDREATPNRLLADLVFGHWGNDLVVHGSGSIGDGMLNRPLRV
jgi:hypothetical protein